MMIAISWIHKSRRNPRRQSLQTFMGKTTGLKFECSDIIDNVNEGEHSS
jgi:hypothetical protein